MDAGDGAAWVSAGVAGLALVVASASAWYSRQSAATARRVALGADKPAFEIEVKPVDGDQYRPNRRFLVTMTRLAGGPGSVDLRFWLNCAGRPGDHSMDHYTGPDFVIFDVPGNHPNVFVDQPVTRFISFADTVDMVRVRASLNSTDTERPKDAWPLNIERTWIDPDPP